MPGNIFDQVSITPGQVSSVNSSSTPINDGANFTGAWEDAISFDSLIVAVDTDQNGYFDIEFSTDETNVDGSYRRYFRTDRVNPPIRLAVERQYFRVRFYNDSGTNQTHFRLQTKLGQIGLMSFCGDGTLPQNFASVPVLPNDFSLEVALGRREGYSIWGKFGYNLDVDSAGKEIVASFGGAFNQKLASAETLDLVSDDSTDDNTPPGTGARTVRIYGLNSDWEETTEEIDLNGLSSVTTTTSFVGVNRVKAIDSGSNTTNAGTISVTATTSGNTMAEIPAGSGTTQQCLFYVPTGHTLVVSGARFSARKISGNNFAVNFFIYKYDVDASTIEEIFRDSIDTEYNTNLPIRLDELLPVGGKSIIWVEAETSVNNTVVQGRFSGKLCRNTTF